MADNSSQAGNDTFATDDIAGIKHQRVKVEYGADGSATDVSPATPFPVYDPDLTSTGTISATDVVVGPHGGAGVLLSGTPTASSYISLALAGNSAFIVQLTGTFGGGTVWFEASGDSANGVAGSWTTLSSRLLGTNTTTISESTTTAGLYRGNAGGMTYVRMRITGATTPSVQVILRASAAPGPQGMNSPLPSGTNTIGGVDGGTLLTTSGAIAAAGTGTIGPLDISRKANVTFVVKNTVAANGWAGAPVVIFEQSDDNVSWSPLTVLRNDSNEARYLWTLPVNTASASLVFEAPAEGVSYARARFTTGPTTNGLTCVIAGGGMPFTPFTTAFDRKDVGRTAVTLSLQGVTAGTTATEAIQTVTISKGTAATSTNTTYALGTGKKFRITGIRFQHMGNATGTVTSVVWRIRLNTAGAAIVTSTPIIMIQRTATAAVALAVDRYDVPLGDGYEIDNSLSGATINIAVTATPTFTTNAPTYDVSIVGFEY